MSTPEGIENAFKHIREHSEGDPADVKRAVNLEILRILEEAGVEESEFLEEELKNLTDGSDEAADIGTIGDTYTEDQAAAPTADQHIDLKRAAGIAYVVSDITSATFAAAAGNGDQGAVFLEGARERLLEIGGSDDETEAAKEALAGIVRNAFEVLPVPEQ